MENWVSFCGKDCPELVPAKLGRIADEETSDWMGKRAFAKVMERERSMEARREMASTVSVWMCDRPGPHWGASDLTAVEKKWSFETHPDNRTRRLSLFTPKVAELIGCEPDGEVKKGNAQCEL